MIDYRGASRYLLWSSPTASPTECEALRHVRDTVGLTQIKIMIPWSAPSPKPSAASNCQSRAAGCRSKHTPRDHGISETLIDSLPLATKSRPF
jgi:hypothetical protein